MVRILIIKTSSLGDIIHCLPVVNDIKYFVPESSIDWLVEESFADIPRLHPQIDHYLS
jgi:heptosyltransferase-1